MSCLRFNIFALAEPRTRDEYIAFLQETLLTAADIVEQTERLTAQMDRIVRVAQAKGWDD